MSLLGIIGRGFGALTAVAPALIVQDRADGTGADATIIGGAADGDNRVYVVRRSGGDWQLAGARVGPGTVPLELEIGSYIAHVLATAAGATATSALVAFAASWAPAVGSVVPGVEFALRRERVHFRAGPPGVQLRLSDIRNHYRV